MSQFPGSLANTLFNYFVQDPQLDPLTNSYTDYTVGEKKEPNKKGLDPKKQVKVIEQNEVLPSSTVNHVVKKDEGKEEVKQPSPLSTSSVEKKEEVKQPSPLSTSSVEKKEEVKQPSQSPNLESKQKEKEEVKKSSPLSTSSVEKKADGHEWIRNAMQRTHKQTTEEYGNSYSSLKKQTQNSGTNAQNHTKEVFSESKKQMQNREVTFLSSSNIEEIRKGIQQSFSHGTQQVKNAFSNKKEDFKLPQFSFPEVTSKEKFKQSPSQSPSLVGKEEEVNLTSSSDSVVVQEEGEEVQQSSSQSPSLVRKEEEVNLTSSSDSVVVQEEGEEDFKLSQFSFPESILTSSSDSVVMQEEGEEVQQSPSLVRKEEEEVNLTSSSDSVVKKEEGEEVQQTSQSIEEDEGEGDQRIGTVSIGNKDIPILPQVTKKPDSTITLGVRPNVLKGFVVTMLILVTLASIGVIVAAVIRDTVGFPAAGQWIQHKWQVLSHGFLDLMQKEITLKSALMYTAIGVGSVLLPLLGVGAFKGGKKLLSKSFLSCYHKA